LMIQVIAILSNLIELEELAADRFTESSNCVMCCLKFLQADLYGEELSIQAAQLLHILSDNNLKLSKLLYTVSDDTLLCVSSIDFLVNMISNVNLSPYLRTLIAGTLCNLSSKENELQLVQTILPLLKQVLEVDTISQMRLLIPHLAKSIISSQIVVSASTGADIDICNIKERENVAMETEETNNEEERNWSSSTSNSVEYSLEEGVERCSNTNSTTTIREDLYDQHYQHWKLVALSQQHVLEIITNIFAGDDDEDDENGNDSMEDKNTDENNDDVEEKIEISNEPDFDEKKYIEISPYMDDLPSLAASPEIAKMFLESGIFHLIIGKCQFSSLPDDLRQDLLTALRIDPSNANYDNTLKDIEQLVLTTELRALSAFSNMICHLASKAIENSLELWGMLCHLCEISIANAELLEAASTALCCLLRRKSEDILLNAELSYKRRIFELAKDFRSEITRRNAAAMLGFLGRHSLSSELYEIGGVLLFCLNDPSLLVVMEALNSIFDIFSDDNSKAIIAELQMLTTLRHLYKKLRVSKKDKQLIRDRELFLRVEESIVNLRRFIAYLG